MGGATRSGVTLAGLVLLLVAGAAWGWAALTAPFPGKSDASTCVEVAVDKGDKVFTDQVVVSVYNAGDREGLAGRTLQLLKERGFVAGDSANAPDGTDVPVVQVWAPDPENPAVRLLLRQLGPAHKLIERSSPGDGVTLVVGDGFRKFAKGPKSVVATKDAEICSPPY